MWVRKRHIIIVALGAMTLLFAACAPKSVFRPEAFVSQACTEADVAEEQAQANMQEYYALKSTLEEHEARLVELQRMRSRIVTDRMSDEELAQWQPELLPWEHPEPEPEPEEVESYETTADEERDAVDSEATDADAVTHDSDAFDADGGYGFDSDTADADDVDAAAHDAHESTVSDDAEDATREQVDGAATEVEEEELSAPVE